VDSWSVKKVKKSDSGNFKVKGFLTLDRPPLSSS